VLKITTFAAVIASSALAFGSSLGTQSSDQTSEPQPAQQRAKAEGDRARDHQRPLDAGEVRIRADHKKSEEQIHLSSHGRQVSKPKPFPRPGTQSAPSFGGMNARPGSSPTLNAQTKNLPPTRAVGNPPGTPQSTLPSVLAKSPPKQMEPAHNQRLFTLPKPSTGSPLPSIPARGWGPGPVGGQPNFNARNTTSLNGTGMRSKP
jgi:hypothetical protein